MTKVDQTTYEWVFTELEIRIDQAWNGEDIAMLYCAGASLAWVILQGKEQACWFTPGYAGKWLIDHL